MTKALTPKLALLSLVVAAALVLLGATLLPAAGPNTTPVDQAGDQDPEDDASSESEDSMSESEDSMSESEDSMSEEEEEDSASDSDSEDV